MILYNTYEVEQKKINKVSTSPVKKTIFTLNIGNYSPEITDLTYPFIQKYANSIDANFHIISKRKFPGYPILYEKMQVFELGEGNDWNIFVDSDCLISPNLFDITEVLPENTVMTYGADFAGGRFKYDNFFRRDGRNIGASTFFTVASSFCIDIWEPLNDITLDEAIGNIKMTELEKSLGHKPGYGINDYLISRNMAKYGIKYKTFPDLLQDIGRPFGEFFFHDHLVGDKEKAKYIREKIKEWNST